jgi:hypothetical protein
LPLPTLMKMLPGLTGAVAALGLSLQPTPTPVGVVPALVPLAAPPADTPASPAPTPLAPAPGPDPALPGGVPLDQVAPPTV